mgnify:CR=1 FL=1
MVRERYALTDTVSMSCDCGTIDHGHMMGPNSFLSSVYRAESLAMHIYRIDHDHSQTHSWYVTIQRRGRIYHRHFTDSVYGGKRKALDAAKVYRDSLPPTIDPARPLPDQEEEQSFGHFRRHQD